MKLDARRVGAFLRDPGPARVVLLHGDDEGLVRQRAHALTLAVAGSADDPFRVASLGREEHARLAEEASAIAMLGGRRVIRVREAGDALAAAVQSAIALPGDSLLVLEAPAALPARSKLRALVEAAPEGVAIACYPEEGRALEARIAAALRDAGITIDADALAYMAERMGADSAVVAGEIDKLVLFAGPGGTVDLDAARACAGDAAAVAFDDTVFAATGGEVARADRAAELALAEGAAPVAIIRTLLQHLARLHLARSRIEGGAAPDEAVRAVRPPVFFKRTAEFTRALRRWDTRRLLDAMAEARRVELACKQTGAPDTLLVRRYVLALARQSAR